MPGKYLVGLDIGTSGAKCLLTDFEGKVIASATREYPLMTPRAGWAEQRPEDWWRAVCEGSRSIMAASGVSGADVAAVSFSGQMHGLVALDEARNVIRPAILWCDQRTREQCDWLEARAGGVDGIVKYTNNRMLTGYTGGKLLWLREKEPESFERMRAFCCPKDYVRLMLTGELATDASDASGTGFFDTKNRRWSRALIAIAGLDETVFPTVLESDAFAGRVTREAAALTGLPEGLPAFAGGGDAVIQTTGAGLIATGALGIVIGTAGNVSTGLSAYADNPGGKLQMFCNNAKDLWHAFGCTLTAGGAYRWYRDALCEADVAEARRSGRGVYDIMGDAAASSRPGANGVTFLPYLTGERCPYPDADARGAFLGLSLKTTRADITRAVMEGVTYSLKQVADLMAGFAPGERVILSGGGASSPLWRQMTADITRLPVYTMSAASEGGAYGAIMVAGVGAGAWKDLREAVGILRVESETEPCPANFAAYADAFDAYSAYYPALKPTFGR